MDDSKFKTHKEAIDHIIERANNEPKLLQLLIKSLVKAKKRGLKTLDEGLFSILPWPSNLMEYVGYLKFFRTSNPRQSENPVGREPKSGNSQESYDRLSHFYYLVNQRVAPNDTTLLQNDEGFKKWLVYFVEL